LIGWGGGSEPLNQITLSKHLLAASVASSIRLARVMTRYNQTNRPKYSTNPAFGPP